MKKVNGIGSIVAVWVAIPLVMGGCKGVVDPAVNAVWTQSLGDTSITVFPTFVRTADEPEYNSIEASQIGEFFTNEGLANVTLSDARVPITGEWQSNQAAMLGESIADFAQYIADHPIETDYALLAEHLIGGRDLPVGIHGYILDGQGQVADVVLLNSHHATFADADPATVEDCTTVLIRVLGDELTPSS
jgi:hypothetical protein